MSVTYAGAKGRPIPLPASPLKGEGRGGHELSDEQKAAIAERVRKVQKHLPEAWEAMKVLSKEGSIDGMRSLLSVTVYDEVNHGAG